MDTGWAAGGKNRHTTSSGPRELEAMYHSNTGTRCGGLPTGYANIRGRIDQLS